VIEQLDNAGSAKPRPTLVVPLRQTGLRSLGVYADNAVHRQMKDTPPVVGEDDEHEEDVEPRREHGEETVHRRYRTMSC
jgi:hypothetical protein